MSQEPDREEPFVREVRRQAERARQGRELGFWQGLTLVGAVGWMVVLPAVAGALLGRLLDGAFDSGIFWTLPLLLLGLAAGCATAWRHIQREMER